MQGVPTANYQLPPSSTNSSGYARLPTSQDEDAELREQIERAKRISLAEAGARR